MGHYVAFLRGINVGGKNKIAMANLRSLFEHLGFKDVRTLLQSGNVVFEANGKDAEIERRLEAETLARVGLDITYIVRSAAELTQIMAANPFSEQAKSDPAHLLVLFLKGEPSTHASDKLNAAIKGREEVKINEREAYAVYPDGIGTSKLTNTVLEKCLGTRVTGRNWNTLAKLAQMAGGRK